MAQNPVCTYEIEVLTGNGIYHGTNSNVSISLFGEDKRISNDIQLTNSETYETPFRRGQLDKFKVQISHLGFISKITLKSENTAKDAWFVKQVVIRCLQEDKEEAKFSFSFQQWFSAKRGGEHSAIENGFPVLAVSTEGDYKTLHYTWKFKLADDSKLIILRRGFSVLLRLSVSRPLLDEDTFDIVLSAGERPRESNKSLVIAKKCIDQDPRIAEQDKWAYHILENSSCDVIIELFIPSTALVARYDLSIEVNGEEKFKRDGKVIILFNPWCKNDEVYMDSTDDLREYVLRQNGRVYQGTERRPYAKSWYFGQFEEICLQVAFFLLENDLKITKRSSAAEVARILSTKCNSFDNDGVLQGNWSGDYSGGKNPSFWSTTPAILKQYVDNDYKPVMYGQCWVFSALVVGLMRALGIPCRSVTNFSSAHDTDANVTHDVYYKPDGEVDEEYTNDSIWNFHVWNDAWMQRGDLDSNDYGWQAIDATPQEESGGIFQMGPAPLSAIKRGLVDVKYDTKFVFAEVNADVVYWEQGDDEKYKPTSRSNSNVGLNISTKQVNSQIRHDITNEYKHKEDSLLERAAVRRAMKLVDHPLIKDKPHSYEVEVHAMKDDYYAGEKIEIKVTVKNLLSEAQSLLLKLKPKFCRYDGNPVAELQTDDKKQRKIRVGGNGELTIMFSIAPVKYIKYLEGNDSIRLHASVANLDTKEFATEDDIIDILKPDIEFKDIDSHVKTDKNMKITVAFTNPLEISLEKCEAYIGGSLVPATVYDSGIADIPANGRFQKTYEFKIGKVEGKNKKKKLMYTFSCKQLGGFNGVVRVTVSDP